MYGQHQRWRSRSSLAGAIVVDKCAPPWLRRADDSAECIDGCRQSIRRQVACDFEAERAARSMGQTRSSLTPFVTQSLPRTDEDDTRAAPIATEGHSITHAAQSRSKGVQTIAHSEQHHRNQCAGDNVAPVSDCHRCDDVARPTHVRSRQNARDCAYRTRDCWRRRCDCDHRPFHVFQRAPDFRHRTGDSYHQPHDRA